MQLGKLPKPIFILAPMDDVTDTVFRQIVADCAPPDLYVTEFVNVDGLQSPGRPKLVKKLRFTDKERPIIAQLWGLKPENYYKTVKELIDGTLVAEANALQGKDEKRSKPYGEYGERASESLTPQSVANTGRAAGSASRQASVFRGKRMGFDGVDINMGCPVKTVTKNGACAALIKNRELASEIIDAVKEAARSTSSGHEGDDFPVSVKTRVGFTTVDMSWIEFLLTKKLNMLSIHGRTAKQKSLVPANWDMIGQARQLRDSTCPSTLIIGNGDVKNRAHGQELIDKYKLDGVMIGRGIFDDPFAFAKDSPWVTYSRERKIDLYAKHVNLFAKTWKNGEYRFESLRKFCKVYISGFDGAHDLRAKLMETATPKETLDILNAA